MSCHNFLFIPLMLLLCLGQVSCFEFPKNTEGQEGGRCTDDGKCDPGLSCCVNHRCRTTCVWEDGTTGLMWMNPPPSEQMNWTQAEEFCETWNYQGMNGWRLPRMDELCSLLDGCPELGEEEKCGFGADYSRMTLMDAINCFYSSQCESSSEACYVSEDLVEASSVSPGSPNYWSSDTYIEDDNEMWKVSYTHQGSAIIARIETATGYVRCVRDN